MDTPILSPALCMIFVLQYGHDFSIMDTCGLSGKLKDCSELQYGHDFSIMDTPCRSTYKRTEAGLQYGHDFSIMDTALNNNYLLNFLESLNLPFIVRMKTPSHLLIERLRVVETSGYCSK